MAVLTTPDGTTIEIIEVEETEEIEIHTTPPMKQKRKSNGPPVRMSHRLAFAYGALLQSYSKVF